MCLMCSLEGVMQKWVASKRARKVVRLEDRESRMVEGQACAFKEPG